MKNLYFFLLFLIAFSLSAQHISTTDEDFNSDGFEDVLKCSYEIGSDFGGANCELTDGKTQNTFILSNYSCFCDIKTRVVVAPILRKKENEFFFYNLKKEVLPKFRSTPDQSLYWIIKSSLNTKRPKSHPYFDLVFNPQTSWRYEVPELPTTYYIEIGVETLSIIIPEKNTSLTSSRSLNEKDFLIYYGDTHSSLESVKIKDFIPVTKNANYEILKTAHGVIAKKEAVYKWLFVTDKHLNASPQKLRWASIEEVVLQDNYIIIKQGLAPDNTYNIYIVNIETGTGGRLKIDFDLLLEKGIEIQDLTPEERFSLDDNFIVIGKKRKKLKFSLEKIKQELESLTKEN